MGAVRYVCVLIGLLWVCAGSAQQPPLQKKVVVTGSRFTFDALGALVYRQTGLRFSYNAGRLHAAQKIHFDKKEYTLEELLLQVRQHTRTVYVIYGEHIIFRSEPVASGSSDGRPGQGASAARKQAQPARGRSTIVSAKAIAANHGGLPVEKKKNGEPAALTNMAALQQQGVAAGSPGKRILYFPGPLLPVPLRAPSRQSAPVHSRLATHAPAAPLAYRPVRPAHESMLFLGAGAAADDALYLQPVLMAGIPALHGIAGWATNFRASGFRYGIGSIVPLRNEWQLHVQVTSGRLKGRPLPIDSNRVIAARSHLQRAAVMMEKRLNSRWAVAGGPVFNYLSTAYYLNGNRQSLLSMGMENRYNDRNLYTVKPLYAITNTFDPAKTSYVKTWIGLQVSLFYRINF